MNRFKAPLLTLFCVLKKKTGLRPRDMNPNEVHEVELLFTPKRKGSKHFI